VKNGLTPKLYLVYIRALVSLYQINTDKCTDILLTQHFINYIRNSNMLQPVSVRLKHVGDMYIVNKCGGLLIYECICRRLLDIGLALLSVEMWFGNVHGQGCKEKSHKVEYCLNILSSQIAVRVGEEK
jgi:hypothetical protein